MATSETEICNSALIKLGADRIISIDDGTERANKCRDLYPTLRDAMLRSHPWNFAIKRIQLALLPDTPLFEYSYQHQIPTDCLRIMRVENDDLLEQYKIEGDKLLSNQSVIKIVYISKVTDVSSMDQNFVEALAWDIAKNMAYSLTNSITFASQIGSEAQRQLDLARSFDGQEGVSQVIGANEWLRERN